LTVFKDKTDPKYVEALGLIEAGKAMLAAHPEADRPGFVPCTEDQRRETKYAERRQVEQQNREAIRTGRKVFDPRPADEPVTEARVLPHARRSTGLRPGAVQADATSEVGAGRSLAP
jgi:hypothetical protein